MAELTPVIVDSSGATLPPVLEIVPSNVKVHLENIRQFHEALLEYLKEGHDYAEIPGTKKQKSLLQPGAEKVMRFFQARPDRDVITKIEDWENGFFYYHYKTKIVHVTTGIVIGEGDGVCSSKEDKYAYRWVYGNELPKHLVGADGKPLPSVTVKWYDKKGGGKYPKYRINNEEAASLQNTIMQMACKRADVKAARTLGCLSGLFTQDLEDLRNVIDIGDYDEHGEEPVKEPAPKKAEAPEKAETTTPSKPEQTTSTTETDTGFVAVTKADVDKVTKFMIEHDEELKNSSAAFSRVQAVFADREIKVDSMGKVLANPGHRKALMNYLQDTYGAVPEL